MAEIRWTSQAADDLENIAEYIAADSPYYAELFVVDVIEAVERVGQFPYHGRIVPEFHDPSIRESLLGSYRVIYRVRSGTVEILTVFHGARLLRRSRLARD